jgi:multiple sugar transport system substrate-binding protein
MKKIIILMIFAISTMTLVGCGNNASDDGTTTISFFGWGSSEEQENFQTLINNFMEINEDISVTYSAVSSDQYMRTLKNKINNLPDVFYMPDTEFIQWADAGRLLNLDSYVSAEETADVWPIAAEHYLYDRNSYTLGEGSLYALPKDLGPFSMVMNVDLFNEIVASNNLDISAPDPDIPMTWDEFIVLNQALTGTYNGNKVYGITHYELAAAVYSNNADFISANGRTQTITDPNFAEAVQFIADLDLEYHVMPTADDQASTNGYQRFLNQGAVFSFMGPWDLKGYWENTSFEFDLVPIPVGPAEDAKSTAWVGSMGIAVSADSKEKEASAKLAKYLTISEESQTMAYQLGQSVPNLMTIAKTDFINNVGYTDEQLYPVNKQMFLSIIEGNEYVQGKSRSTYYTYDTAWYDDFVSELLVVYTGSQSASSFMNMYADTLQDALDESNSYFN